MCMVIAALCVPIPAHATIGIDQWRYVDSVKRDSDAKNAIIYRNEITDPLWAARAEFGIAKWNTLQCAFDTGAPSCSGVRFRQANPGETPTLIINEDPALTCEEAGGIAGYLGRNNDSDLLTFWPNAAACSNLKDVETREVFIHELGHSLGLAHQPTSALPDSGKRKKHHRDKGVHHHHKNKHHRAVHPIARGTTQMLEDEFLGTDDLGSLDVNNYYILWVLCGGDYSCANQAYGVPTPDCADKNVVGNDDVGCE